MDCGCYNEVGRPGRGLRMQGTSEEWENLVGIEEDGMSRMRIPEGILETLMS